MPPRLKQKTDQTLENDCCTVRAVSELKWSLRRAAATLARPEPASLVPELVISQNGVLRFFWHDETHNGSKKWRPCWFRSVRTGCFLRFVGLTYVHQNTDWNHCLLSGRHDFCCQTWSSFDVLLPPKVWKRKGLSKGSPLHWGLRLKLALHQFCLWVATVKPCLHSNCY